MTLWEIAKSWPHEMWFSGIVDGAKVGPAETQRIHSADCRRCQLEQWAREKNSELRARSECLKEETPQDFKDGWFTGVMSVVHDDLGVPDDEIRRQK